LLDHLSGLAANWASTLPRSQRTDYDALKAAFQRFVC